MKNWNFGYAKTPGLIDRNRPSIRNMGSFTINQLREFSRQPKSNSSCYLGMVLVLLFSPLTATQHEEVQVIEELILATKKNLYAQETLLKKLNEYHSARDAFIADPDSSKLATKLVKKAVALQTQIEDDYLAHLFSNDFLTELAFYHQVGKRHLVAR